MPDVTLNNKSDLVTNLKRVAKNIINNNEESTTKLTKECPNDSTIKENLLYLLLGFDTEHMTIKNEDIEVNPLYKNKHHIYPFKRLAISVKSLKHFIRQMQFANDYCKQIFSEYLSSRIQEYQVKLVENKELGIEEILIKLQPFETEFNEYALAIKEFSSIYGLDMYNYFFAKNQMSRKEIYSHIVHLLSKEIENKVLNWCTNSQIDRDFFIIENTNEMAFDECFWKDKYKIVQNIPSMYCKLAKKILIIGIMQKLLCKFNYERIPISTCPLNVDAFYTSTHDYFKTTILKKLRSEIIKIYDIYSITNYGTLLTFYDDNLDKIFTPYENTYIKTDQYKHDFNIKMADTRINHYILKVLNVERHSTDVRRNIFENLTINYKPELFSIFFSSKIYFELELIFRFLLQLHNFEYVIVKREKNSFNVLILNFIAYIKSVIYTNIVNDLSLPYTLEMVGVFETFTKLCLRKLYFTNENVFKIISDIFDITFEYVYCKPNSDLMHKSTMELLLLLRDELLKQNDDHGFLFYICRLIK